MQFKELLRRNKSYSAFQQTFIEGRNRQFEANFPPYLFKKEWLRDWALNASDVNPVSCSQSCYRYRVDVTDYLAQSPIRRVSYFVNRDFDRLLKIKIELKSHSIACFRMLYASTS